MPGPWTSKVPVWASTGVVGPTRVLALCCGHGPRAHDLQAGNRRLQLAAEQVLLHSESERLHDKPVRFFLSVSTCANMGYIVDAYTRQLASRLRHPFGQVSPHRLTGH